MDSAELAYGAWLEEEERTRERNIILARKYFDGLQGTKITDRQRQYLGRETGQEFSANFCRPVVSAVVERLYVSGFSGWKGAADVWRSSRMDAGQRTVHEAATRDGESFVLVARVAGRGLCLLPHPRYTDPTVEGTGFGCRAYYPDGDPNAPMEFGVKRWVERTADQGRRTETRQRMTVYYPDRIERYVMGRGGEWEPFTDAARGQPFPVPWLDRYGRPLGIPLVHFQNPDCEPEHWDAMPLQDAINKTLLDVLAASDASGFPILFASGFFLTKDGGPPADDGSNLLELVPGSWISTGTQGADLKAIRGADLGPMLAVVDSLIVKLAQVTDTPLGRLQLRQVKSAETQREEEGPLLAKVRSRQTVFGNAWADCMELARKLEREWGEKSGVGTDEEGLIETEWEPAEPRAVEQVVGDRKTR